MSLIVLNSLEACFSCEVRWSRNHITTHSDVTAHSCGRWTSGTTSTQGAQYWGASAGEHAGVPLDMGCIPILYLSLVGTCSGAVDPGSDDPDGYRAEKHRHQCLINGFTSVWLWILTVRGWPWVIGCGSWVVGHQYESNYRENIQILSLSTNTKS